jgi:hypothetical protein
MGLLVRGEVPSATIRICDRLSLDSHMRKQESTPRTSSRVAAVTVVTSRWPSCQTRVSSISPEGDAAKAGRRTRRG